MEATLAILMVSALADARVVSTVQVCFVGWHDDKNSSLQNHWVLPYEDPRTCSAIRLGGMDIGKSRYRESTSLDVLTLTEKPDEIKKIFDCPVKCTDPSPLGLKDGTISDERFSASSSRDIYPLRNVRLDSFVSYWSPNTNENSWVEVDLGESTAVSGIITQGSPWVNGVRVTKFKVAFVTSPSSTYEYVRDANGNIKVFTGNTDSTPNQTVRNLFHTFIVATRVRIEPTKWIVDVALRFELLGCRI